MRYFVTVHDQTFEVELSAAGIAVDGEAVSADLWAVPDSPVHRLEIGGRSHALHATTPAAGEWHIHLDGERFVVKVEDERTRAIRAMTGSGAAGSATKPVRAPMPGLVVRIAVVPGDVVAAGQGVLIMEAMKMENELKADAAGTVRSVLVTPGQAVEKGTVLIEFEGDGHG
jgi:pyruvate carboxylase subunit B